MNLNFFHKTVVCYLKPNSPIQSRDSFHLHSPAHDYPLFIKMSFHMVSI